MSQEKQGEACFRCRGVIICPESEATGLPGTVTIGAIMPTLIGLRNSPGPATVSDWFDSLRTKFWGWSPAALD